MEWWLWLHLHLQSQTRNSLSGKNCYKLWGACNFSQINLTKKTIANKQTRLIVVNKVLWKYKINIFLIFYPDFPKYKSQNSIFNLKSYKIRKPSVIFFIFKASGNKWIFVCLNLTNIFAIIECFFIFNVNLFTAPMHSVARSVKWKMRITPQPGWQGMLQSYVLPGSDCHGWFFKASSRTIWR